jgi:20S proteasome subunit alpha 6
MFRNQYDNDITVWSPQGRIHQIEYAMEAVKLGAVTLAIKNKDHVVVAAMKRSSGKLMKNQEKIFAVDDHIAISMSGLLADGQQLAKFMRGECLDSRWSFDTPISVERLVRTVANKSQRNTQFYGRRPYGVGLLVVGCDEKGPHIFQTCPSANYYECEGMAIGSRSQSARTYLERKLGEIENTNLDQLITHALHALSSSLGNDQEMTKLNVELGFVGKDTKFRKLSQEELENYMVGVETKKPSRNVTQQPAAAAPADSASGADADEPAPQGGAEI